jgi:tRNA-splicing ligase RtcB (3'-phosphate/5'-hydroxy nucleic acid ligase)
MFEVKGKYNTAVVYSNSYDEKAVGQIIELCNQDFTIGANIRVMSDYHFGAGCTIGFTANLGNKVVPNLVGVDLNCGCLCANLGILDFDLNNIDKVIHTKVPSGHNAHETKKIKFDKLNEILCLRELRHSNIFEKQIGTLGGGNHAIEIDIDNNGNKYLFIHSGSRNLGKQVAEYYQSVAIESCKGLGDLNIEKSRLIEQLKLENKKELIQSEVKKLQQKFEHEQPHYPKDLCFLEGKSREDYLHDMKICQEYASLNRITMANIILKELFDTNINSFEYFESIHNYINFNDNIIRKGAVSAYKGEKLIIPMNMRDGCLICTGKGNFDWNFSAPHGAGRLMGRNEAKRQLKLSEFQETMEGIYSTTVNQSTLDEAPGAYKPMQEIIDNIQDTVEIVDIIKPIYNFKDVAQ